jgi:hypothetical protein
MDGIIKTEDITGNGSEHGGNTVVRDCPARLIR